MVFIIDTFSHEQSVKSLHSSHWKQALESNTLTINDFFYRLHHFTDNLYTILTSRNIHYQLLLKQITKSLLIRLKQKYVNYTHCSSQTIQVKQYAFSETQAVQGTQRGLFPPHTRTSLHPQKRKLPQGTSVLFQMINSVF